eukprot:TRINITY_DN94831_c0_g1_i1.p1 TRINITY_DN94831_c0_g1~~TRINITY_DN94831_c0_g1_i1.p1  ORF type:complete len:558 (+),score=34.22 TRINITY_DN94831_c0_g1_i1:34-1707(+)
MMPPRILDRAWPVHAWTYVWAACTLMDIWQQPYNWASQVWRALCAVATLLAIMRPSPPSLALAMAVRNGSRIVRMPFCWDSDLWAFSCDLAFCLGLWQARRAKLSEDAPVLIAAPIVRALLGMFYFAAGFWKINTSFLSPRTSCASILLASLLGHIWPQAWGSPPDTMVHLAVHGAPMMTILGECVAGLLVTIPYKSTKLIGLGLMLMLHFGISFTPYPNGIANFSYTAATRYFFILPEASSQALFEAVTTPQSKLGWMTRATAVAAIASAFHFSKPVGVQQMGAIFFTCLALTYMRAMQVELSRASNLCSCPLGLIGWSFVSVMVLPVFAGQVFGLVDLGAPASPFASIRVHGGSNHLLLPTGLIQAWAAGASPLENAFAGGVVRVEHTDSVWLNSLYPSEHTSELPPEAVAILHRGGHIGRQFNPTPRRVLGSGVRNFMPRWKPGDGPFLKYTVPAMELRRLIFEAKTHEEAFSISYVRLPGIHGDEAWRSSANGPHVEFFWAANGTQRCTVDGQPCAGDELVLLPELNMLLHKTLVFFPYAVVPEAQGELPCMD